MTEEEKDGNLTGRDIEQQQVDHSTAFQSNGKLLRVPVGAEEGLSAGGKGATDLVSHGDSGIGAAEATNKLEAGIANDAYLKEFHNEVIVNALR